MGVGLTVPDGVNVGVGVTVGVGVWVMLVPVIEGVGVGVTGTGSMYIRKGPNINRFVAGPPNPFVKILPTPMLSISHL